MLYTFVIRLHCNDSHSSSSPVETGRKSNLHKTFRRRPGRLLNVLCTFNLRPVSTGFPYDTGVNGVNRTGKYCAF